MRSDGLVLEVFFLFLLLFLELVLALMILGPKKKSKMILGLVLVGLKFFLEWPSNYKQLCYKTLQIIWYKHKQKKLDIDSKIICGQVLFSHERATRILVG